MKTVAEICGLDPKGLEPEEVYSASSFNQLCHDFDKMKEERDALKAKLEELTKDGEDYDAASRRIVAEIEQRTAEACAKVARPKVGRPKVGISYDDYNLSVRNQITKEIRDGKWREYL